MARDTPPPPGVGGAGKGGGREGGKEGRRQIDRAVKSNARFHGLMSLTSPDSLLEREGGGRGASGGPRRGLRRPHRGPKSPQRFRVPPRASGGPARPVRLLSRPPPGLPRLPAPPCPAGWRGFRVRCYRLRRPARGMCCRWNHHPPRRLRCCRRRCRHRATVRAAVPPPRLSRRCRCQCPVMGRCRMPIP